MTMQARMSSNDNRLYNPSRDVAHNFLQVLDLVASRLEDGVWPELKELLIRENISMDDLGEACGCFCRYIANSKEHPNRSMYDSLKEEKFFNTKPAAQIAVLASIGVCYAGIMHAGIREATIASEGPLMTVPEFMKYAKQFRRYAGMSKWRRKLEHLKSKFYNAFKSFKE